MATAAVTGKLSDFGLQPVAGLYPEIEFVASGPAVASGGRLLITEPVRTTPTSDGDFTVNLQTSDDVVPLGTHYTMNVKWLDSAGNYVRVDSPNWKMRVPTGGGAIADLIQLPFGAALVVTSPTAPPLWLGLAAKWLQMDPNDPNNPTNPANTGDLYEVRDV